MIIETQRLLLRELTLSDAEDMLRLHSRPEVQQYTGEELITDLDEMRDAIAKRIEGYKKYGYGRWATFLKEGMQFTGWSGLAYLPECNETDLGYRFLPEFWGQGIATEASRAILSYGFEHLRLKRIVAIAMKENKASIRVMEKAGMHFYKIAPYKAGCEDAVWYCCDQNIMAKAN